MRNTNRARDLRNLATAGAAVLLCFVALNLSFTMLGDAVLARSAFRLSRISRGDIAADVLVVGNSRGVNSLVGTAPPQTLRVFNLSYNALNRAAIIALTKDYFTHGNRAKVLLIEASGLFGDGANCELKSYWGGLENLRRAGEARCGDDAWMARYLPLTRFNTEIFQRAAYYASAGRASDQDWRNNGRISDAACRRYARDGDPDFIAAGDPGRAAEVRRDVDELRAWVAQHAPGTQVRFVLAPYFAAPPTGRVIDQTVAATDAALGAGAYLNLAKALGGDCRVFADLVHINDAGRARTRAQLIGYLVP